MPRVIPGKVTGHYYSPTNNASLLGGVVRVTPLVQLEVLARLMAEALSRDGAEDLARRVTDDHAMVVAVAMYADGCPAHTLPAKCSRFLADAEAFYGGDVTAG